MFRILNTKYFDRITLLKGVFRFIFIYFYINFNTIKSVPDFLLFGFISYTIFLYELRISSFPIDSFVSLNFAFS